MSKQAATFHGVNGWNDGGESGVVAALYGVDHPKLGWESSVNTSRVLRIEYDEKGMPEVIETKNTIYTKRGEG